MKKYILINYLILLFIGKALGQSTEKNFFCLKLYSGNVVKCDSFVNCFSPFVIADGIKYHFDSVEFYKTSVNFYANTRHLRKGNESYFMPAIPYGKINLYSITITSNPSSQGYYNGTGNTKNSTYLSQSHEYLLYNNGIEKLKRASYPNLKIDLANNPKSMKILRQHKALSCVEYSIYALSVVVFATGIQLIGNMNNNDDNLGTALCVCSIPVYYIGRLLMPPLKNKKIEKALYIFGMEN